MPWVLSVSSYLLTLCLSSILLSGLCTFSPLLNYTGTYPFRRCLPFLTACAWSRNPNEWLLREASWLCPEGRGSPHWSTGLLWRQVWLGVGPGGPDSVSHLEMCLGPTGGLCTLTTCVLGQCYACHRQPQTWALVPPWPLAIRPASLVTFHFALSFEGF